MFLFSTEKRVLDKKEALREHDYCWEVYKMLKEEDKKEELSEMDKILSNVALGAFEMPTQPAAEDIPTPGILPIVPGPGDSGKQESKKHKKGKKKKKKRKKHKKNKNENDSGSSSSDSEAEVDVTSTVIKFFNSFFKQD